MARKNHLGLFYCLVLIFPWWFEVTNQKQYTNHYQKECKHTFHVALNLAASLPLANKKETLPFEQGFSRRRLAKAGVAELQKALAKYRIDINLKK